MKIAGLFSKIRASLPGGAAVPTPSAAPRLPVRRRSYAAAQVNRLTQGWSTMSLSANSDIHAAIDNLRARSRQLEKDNAYAKKFFKMVQTNVVGAAGFQFQARVYSAPNQPDTLANDAIERGWAAFCKRGVCDVAGRSSMRDLCNQAIITAARDGEVLARFVRGAEARNPFGIAIQLLDVERIDTNLNRPAEAGRNAIRLGVEHDGYGRAVALWLKVRHPGEAYDAAGALRGDKHARLPAEDVVHAYIADRPEQLRGVPWMHAGMLELNNLGGYTEAAIVAARVGASKMGFFTKKGAEGQTLVDAEGLADGSDEATGDLMKDADAGTLELLPEGYGFESFDPDYPSAMFAEFVKANLRSVASAFGVAYHALGNDLEGVSFSSIRSGTLEERDHWMMIQEWFIESFLEPIFTQWLRQALAFGVLTMPNGSALPARKEDKFSGHIFKGRRWEWVDPLKDIEADIAAINAGLKAPQDVADKLGMDYEDLLLRIKQAQDMRASSGIELNSLRPAPAAPVPSGAAAAQPAAQAGG